MKLSPERVKEFKDKALSDTIYFSRNVLGFNWANVSYFDDDGRLKGKRVTGPEWGISYEVEAHTQVAEALDSGESLVLILLPRGALKSTLMSGFASKELVRDRDLKILYCMDTAEKASGKLEEIKRIFDSKNNLTTLWKDLKGDKWTKDGFIISGRTMAGDPNPSLAVGSPEKSITGMHFDKIILDDLENEDTVRTPEGLAKVKAFYRKVQPILNPGGQLIVVGTRYADEDLYGWILKEFRDDFKVITVDCGMEPVLDEHGRETLKGTPTFKHLNEPFLERQLKNMGMQAFSSQYMNVCMAATRQAFHRENFKYQEWEPWMEELAVYMVTDTATSTEDDACHSVCGIIGVDRGNTAYLLDLWFGRVLPDKYVAVLCDMLEKWDQRVRIKKILMEITTANQVYLPLIKNEWQKRQMRQYAWEMISRGGTSALSKDRRIERLQPRFAEGRFVVVNTVPTYLGQDMVFSPDAWRSEEGERGPDGELVRQFIRWPVTTSKDIPDAIADIDHMDKRGQRLCPGMGVRAASRARKLARRKGRKISPNRLPGPGLNRNPWGGWARKLEA